MHRSPFDEADDCASRDVQSVMFVVTVLAVIVAFAFWLAFG